MHEFYHRGVVIVLMWCDDELSITNGELKMNNIKGYFVDSEGVIYTVANFYERGSNAPYHVIVDGNTVLHCGAYSHGDGYSIDGEYTLWGSLRELSAAIGE